MVLDDQEAVTPAGSPVEVPMPVAPVVVCVMSVKAVLIQSEGLEDAVDTVFDGFTVIVLELVVAEAQVPLVTTAL